MIRLYGVDECRDSPKLACGINHGHETESTYRKLINTYNLMQFSAVPALLEHRARRAKHSLLGSLALLLISGGCAATNELCEEMTIRAMARQAQREYCVPNDLGPAEAIHYKDGWRAGYCDVASGGEGCPPLVPPKKYWDLSHPNRQCLIDEWYRGFAAGAEVAHHNGARDGYFVPVMSCGCGVGNSCPNGCCVNGSACCETTPVSLPEVAEPLAEPVEATEIPDASRFQPQLPAKPKLEYPEEIIPPMTDAMLWEEPIANSTSAWFGQPMALAMDLTDQLDQALSKLDEELAAIESAVPKSTLTFEEIELVNLIEIAEVETPINQPASLLPQSLLAVEKLEEQVAEPPLQRESLDLTNPAESKVKAAAKADQSASPNRTRK